MWSTIIGGTGSDNPRHLIKLKPDGYLVCGQTNSFGSSADALLIKIAEDGTLEWSV